MYIHLGNNYVISARSIIAILNIENSISEDIDDIMHVAIDEKKLINISDNEKKKALIICEDNVYISPISSLTLYKRSLNYHKEGIYFERSPKSK